jgi:hypothetical protein
MQEALARGVWALALGSLLLVHVPVQATVSQVPESVFRYYRPIKENLFAHRHVAGFTVVRFDFSEAGEVQLRFATAMISPCQVEIWREPSGRPSIYVQLINLLQRSPGLSLEEAQARVELEHRQVDVPCGSGLAKSLREGQELSIQWKEPVPAMISVEGSLIRLEVVTGLWDLTLESRPGPGGRFEGFQSPITEWMARVYSAYTQEHF